MEIHENFEVHGIVTGRFRHPDTSDKRDDESWVAYWDRKRHERHGGNCGCLLCANEELLKTMGKTLLPPEMRGWVEE